MNGGLSRLHSADENAVLWLISYGSQNAYEKKIGGLDLPEKAEHTREREVE